VKRFLKVFDDTGLLCLVRDFKRLHTNLDLAVVLVYRYLGGLICIPADMLFGGVRFPFDLRGKDWADVLLLWLCQWLQDLGVSNHG
jgi:hypothetical protein